MDHVSGDRGLARYTGVVLGISVWWWAVGSWVSFFVARWFTRREKRRGAALRKRAAWELPPDDLEWREFLREAWRELYARFGGEIPPWVDRPEPSRPDPGVPERARKVDRRPVMERAGKLRAARLVAAAIGDQARASIEAQCHYCAAPVGSHGTVVDGQGRVCPACLSTARAYAPEGRRGIPINPVPPQPEGRAVEAMRSGQPMGMIVAKGELSAAEVALLRRKWLETTVNTPQLVVLDGGAEAEPRYPWPGQY